MKCGLRPLTKHLPRQREAEGSFCATVFVFLTFHKLSTKGGFSAEEGFGEGAFSAGGRVVLGPEGGGFGTAVFRFQTPEVPILNS